VQKIEASKDAFVLEGSPDTNYGFEPLIFAGEMRYPEDFYITGNAGYCESFLSFDLSSLSNVEKIVFIVVGAVGYDDNFMLDAYTTHALWDEDLITWNNKAPLGTFLGSELLLYLLFSPCTENTELIWDTIKIENEEIKVK